jgi:hypothetical protein
VGNKKKDLKYISRLFLINTLVLVSLLFSVEVFLQIFMTESFAEKQSAISVYWRPPLSFTDVKEGPLFGPTTAHPFWGHTLNPTFGSNNLGFDSKESFPIQRKDGEYIVGIFGGSVAQSLARHIDDNFKNLNVKVCNESKKLRFTSYALAVFKQPQQFNVFHNFLDDFDMAVNIDGHNDAVMTPGPSRPVYYPILFDDLFLLDSKKVSALEKTFRFKNIEFFLISTLRKHDFLLKSNLIFVASRKIIQLLESAAGNARQQMYSAANELKVADPIKTQNEAVSLWSKYVLLQSQISEANQKLSLFFIQPTQYLPNSKRFTGNERKRAINPDEKHASFVRRGFELLGREAVLLKKKNVKIYNYSTIYSDTESEVFMDDCCHVNADGNTILAKNIIEVIKKETSKLRCN